MYSEDKGSSYVVNLLPICWSLLFCFYDMSQQAEQKQASASSRYRLDECSTSHDPIRGDAIRRIKNEKRTHDENPIQMKR